MLRPLFEITIWTNSITGYSNGDIVINYWDEDTSDFIVKKNGTTVTSGADITEPYSNNLYTVKIPNNTTVYQFCSGGDLNYFEFNQSFPYAVRKIEVNSTLCSTNVVCDVNFEGVAEIVKPSTATATDGQITVTATTSNGTVKYSLTDEDYSVMTNTTGVFTGLGIGTYVVYAKDDYNCLDSIIVILDADVTYGPLYRLEYDCLNGDVSVIDIEERDYAGAVTEVIGTGNPFVVRLRGENSELFTPILATEATVGLTSETNFQFLNLFTQDDRKYRVIAKKNGTEFWRGFITPGLYTEQYYTKTNYYVQADCTDQIVTLKDLDFLDKDGNKIKGVNSLIKIISFILSRTDLDLPIRSCVGVFEVDMATTAADDPLAQTHIDTESYYDSKGEPMNCYEVLESIIQSFGSRIFQWGGYWYIIPVDFYTDTISYRQFDTNGDYVSNGTFDPIFDIKTSADTLRAVWANRTQTLEVRGAYGQCDVTHNLVKIPQSVPNGNFDDVDIETEEIKVGPPKDPKPSIFKDYIVQYNDWSLILNNNNASFVTTNKATGNIEANKVDTLQQNYAGVIFSNSNNETKHEDAFFVSKPQAISYIRGDAVNFKFDFFTETNGVEENFLPPVVKFKWRVKLGTYYLQADGSWSTDTGKQWIEVIVGRDNFENWQTIEIKTSVPDLDTTNTTFQISLMHGSFLGGGFSNGLEGGTWEYNGNAVTRNDALKAITTTDKPLGYVVWINSTTNGTNTVTDFYKLVKGKVTSDSNKINSLSGYSPGYVYGLIVPTDYHATTNKVNWKQFEFRGYDASGSYVPDYQFNDGTPKVAVRRFDNVTFELLPNNNIPPESFIYRNVNDSRIKDINNIEILNGDVPDGISNAVNLYINWYRYSDGTPTVYWGRTGVSESEPILQLLSKRIIELHNLPKFKLTGTLKTDTFFGFNASLYEEHSQKYFIPMSMVINDKDNLYDVELQEVSVLTTTGIEDIGEFNSQAFTNAFNI